MGMFVRKKIITLSFVCGFCVIFRNGVHLTTFVVVVVIAKRRAFQGRIHAVVETARFVTLC